MLPSHFKKRSSFMNGSAFAKTKCGNQSLLPVFFSVLDSLDGDDSLDFFPSEGLSSLPDLLPANVALDDERLSVE
jgi:hypothetical protein